MKIGNITLDNNVFLAPMAGISDMSYRIICKEMGAGLVYTEMVSSKGLYYNDEKTERLMRVSEGERPISLQVFGSDPDIMSKVVYEHLNNREDIDIIDINMGCPTPKIVKNGDGSALMKNPNLVGKIIKAMVKVSNKPVTFKIRKGWDDNSINAIEIAKIGEQSGGAAVAIHGRTREEFYSGTADWNIIKNVKEQVSIPVIGNGDIFTPEDGKKMIEYTGCDGIMIGRGCRGNPWIFKRTVGLIKDNKSLPEPSNKERIEMALKHLDMITSIKKEFVAVKEMRKHIAWYIKGMKYSAEMRNNINSISEKSELVDVLNQYLEKIEPN
ncbi:tRNA dihydrouridine synthase DusB [Sporosalibacterium faouarense]|uniref:tRNA dihydrouridine synthase DusB n=1 Tax=Sporosalibacterium faouarense TaxID=516123 RepID=UPI00192BD3A0|nr:tRNA dihydrouridine synthase DusB [Sporosalibacterium faouarense]